LCIPGIQHLSLSEIFVQCTMKWSHQSHVSRGHHPQACTTHFIAAQVSRQDCGGDLLQPQRTPDSGVQSIQIPSAVRLQNHLRMRTFMWNQRCQPPYPRVQVHLEALLVTPCQCLQPGQWWHVTWKLSLRISDRALISFASRIMLSLTDACKHPSLVWDWL
jgi:hypothetical protein